MVPIEEMEGAPLQQEGETRAIAPAVYVAYQCTLCTELLSKFGLVTMLHYAYRVLFLRIARLIRAS